MHFPTTIDFVIESDSKRQALKVLEESAELVEAIKEDSEKHALEEAMDVLQALANLCATMGWSDGNLVGAYVDVFMRNKARGRYERSAIIGHEAPRDIGEKVDR